MEAPSLHSMNEARTRVSVNKKVRTETELVVVNLSQGEYLQYVLSSESEAVRFTLMDAGTKEVILSDRAPATMQHPMTYSRLWPVVGDRPQRESSVILAMEFTQARVSYHFQVLHRNADGSWTPAIDLDFESPMGGDTYLYRFPILAE